MLNGERLLSQLVNLMTNATQGKICVGSETISLSSSVSKLTVPSGATTADMTLECAAGSTNVSAAARYSLDANAPSATISSTGMPIGDYDTIEISNPNNLQAFKIISADGVTKYLKVIYYK